MKEQILATLGESNDYLQAFMENDDSITAVRDAARILIKALRAGHAVYSCGNGGSMSDAMHFAEELTGRYRKHRRGIAATAISDPGHITCVANDYGYEHVFSRYLEARARPGDCLLAISTSGTSKNVIRAAEFAHEHQMFTISLTGAPGSTLGELAAIDISAGHSEYADRVQEMHIKIIHVLIELIERDFFPENYASDNRTRQTPAE